MNESKVKLVLMVGHSLKAQGASLHGGGSEYQYNKKVAERAAQYAKQELSELLEVHVIYRDGIGRTGAYNKAKTLDPTAVIELHFNAFNKRVAGTELLYNDDRDHRGVDEKEFANHILKAMYSLFRPGQKPGSRALRGSKEVGPGERGFGNVSKILDCPSILVEPFFGDTASEAKMGREKLKDYAKMLCDSTLDFFA